MNEKIFDASGVEIAQRDPAKLYKYTTRNGANCYVELNVAEKAQRDKDAADHEARMSAPKPKTADERIAELESRLAALEAKSKP